jgi:hypothetical protein
MSQIMIRLSVMGLLLFGLAALVGCGSDSNTQSPFDADAQQHADGWLPASHATAATLDMASCQQCHGEDLLGGISKVGCTGCHLGGPTSAHPTTWTSTTILSLHGKYVVANTETSCRNIYCHGSALQGVPNSGPSCASPFPCHSTFP